MMTSDKKLLANRNNAKNSTGPKSASGKALASRNAVRHGLASLSFSESISARAEKIATELCQGDQGETSGCRYDVAIAIGEAQAAIEQIREYRATRLAAVTASTVRDPQALSELVAIDRYERRAWSRRQRAIMMFETLGILERIEPPPT